MTEAIPGGRREEKQEPESSGILSNLASSNAAKVFRGLTTAAALTAAIVEDVRPAVAQTEIANAQGGVDSQESKIPSAEEIETMVRNALTGLVRADASPSSAQKVDDQLRVKFFGGQNPHAALEAFRSSGLPFRGDIVPFFQEANNAVGPFLGSYRDYVEFVFATMKVETLDKAVNISRKPIDTRSQAEEIRSAALKLARANDRLVAKIAELKKK